MTETFFGALHTKTTTIAWEIIIYRNVAYNMIEKLHSANIIKEICLSTKEISTYIKDA